MCCSLNQASKTADFPICYLLLLAAMLVCFCLLQVYPLLWIYFWFSCYPHPGNTLTVNDQARQWVQPRVKRLQISTVTAQSCSIFFMNISFSICCLPLANHRTTAKVILFCFCFLYVQFYICFLRKVFANLFMPPQTEIPPPVSDFREFFIHSGY